MKQEGIIHLYHSWILICICNFLLAIICVLQHDVLKVGSWAPGLLVIITFIVCSCIFHVYVLISDSMINFTVYCNLSSLCCCFLIFFFLFPIIKNTNQFHLCVIVRIWFLLQTYWHNNWDCGCFVQMRVLFKVNIQLMFSFRGFTKPIQSCWGGLYKNSSAHFIPSFV